MTSSVQLIRDKRLEARDKGTDIEDKQSPFPSLLPLGPHLSNAFSLVETSHAVAQSSGVTRGSSKQGFSLVEISIVLVILSVVLSGVLPYITESVDSGNVDDTLERVEAIENALLAFKASSEDRMPCPADPAAAPRDATFGFETATPGTCTGSLSAANSVAGDVPVKDIGLPDEYAFDGYGRKFTYAVTTAATSSWTDGAITVNDSTPAARTTAAVYVLISHGPNGHGGRTKAAGTARYAGSNAGANELENCDCDANAAITTYNDVFVQTMGTTDFDDIVRYRTKEMMDTALSGGGGSGGGGGGGGSCTDAAMAPAGFPDAITCNHSGGSEIITLIYVYSSPVYGAVYRFVDNVSTGVNDEIRYNTDGTYNAYVGDVGGYDCATNSWSIADLESNDRTAYFCGGSGSGSGSGDGGPAKWHGLDTAVWPDALICSDGTSVRNYLLEGTGTGGIVGYHHLDPGHGLWFNSDGSFSSEAGGSTGDCSGQSMSQNVAADRGKWYGGSDSGSGGGGSTSVAFLAAGETASGGNGAVLSNFASVRHNVGNAYNNSTGIFTAPEDGIYHFSGSTLINDSNDALFCLRKNSSALACDYQRAGDNIGSTISTTFELAAGDEVTLYTDEAIQTSWGDYYHTFSGHLVGGGSGSGSGGAGGGSGFMVTVASDTIPGTGALITIDFDTVVKDDASWFDTASDKFTAPADGWYQFSGHVGWTNISSTTLTGFRIASDAGQVCYVFGSDSITAASPVYDSCSGAIYLTAGQQAWAEVVQSSGSDKITFASFSGVAVGGGSGASGSGWEDVDLSSTDDFDPQCAYVMEVSGATLGSARWRASTVQPSVIQHFYNGMDAFTTSGYLSISSTSKNTAKFHQDNYGNNTIYPDHTVTKIEKNCSSGSGGGSGGSLPTCSDGEILAYDSGSWVCDDGTLAIIGGGGGGGSGGDALIDKIAGTGTTITPVTITETNNKWPDYIVCDHTTAGNKQIFILTSYHPSSWAYYAAASDQSSFFNYQFNPDGSYGGARGTWTTANCGASGSDIESICNDNRCGFFGGGSGGSSSPVAFSGYINGPLDLTGPEQAFTGFVETVDSHNAFDGSAFTVPEDGYYSFAYGQVKDSWVFGVNEDYYLYLAVNGTRVNASTNFSGEGPERDGTGAGYILDLNAGDVVTLLNSTDGDVNRRFYSVTFSGHKIGGGSGGGTASVIAPKMRENQPALPMAPDGNDWADAIICTGANGAEYTLELSNSSSVMVRYSQVVGSSTTVRVEYNPTTGAVTSTTGDSNIDGHDCPTTYTAATKVYYGGGGSGSSSGSGEGDTMIEDWPDAILCGDVNDANNPLPLLLAYKMSTAVRYSHHEYHTNYTITYNLDGTVNSQVGMNAAGPYSCDNETITQLYADNRAFNFVGGGSGSGGGGGGSCTDGMVSGWPDVIQCDVDVPDLGGRILYLQNAPYDLGGGTYHYVEPEASGSSNRIIFNGDGTLNWSAYVSSTCNTDIASIKAADQDHYFGCGGSGGGGSGDNLGNHTATQDLDMATHDVINAGGYFHSSDALLKESIRRLTGMDALDMLEHIHGVSYNWKDSGEAAMGILAQDVEQVMPQAVRTNEAGLKSVEYDQLVAPMIEAIKELKSQNAQMQVQIASLSSADRPQGMPLMVWLLMAGAVGGLLGFVVLRRSFGRWR